MKSNFFSILKLLVFATAVIPVSTSCSSHATPQQALSRTAALPQSLVDGTVIEVAQSRFYKLNGQWYYRYEGEGEDHSPLPTHISNTENPNMSVTSYEDNNGNFWHPAEVRYAVIGNYATIYLSGESRHGHVITSSASEKEGEYIYSETPAKLKLSKIEGNRYYFATKAVSGSPVMWTEPKNVNTIIITTNNGNATTQSAASIPSSLTGKTLNFSVAGASHGFCAMSEWDTLKSNGFSGLDALLNRTKRPNDSAFIDSFVNYRSISFSGSHCTMIAPTSNITRAYTSTKISPTKILVVLAETEDEGLRSIILEFTSPNGGKAWDMGEEEDFVGNITFSVQ